MPFRFTNGLIKFLCLIDFFFGPEFEPVVFDYLNDIIIVTHEYKEHIKWPERVLKKLPSTYFVVNPKKSEFGCSRLRPDPEITPILAYIPPQNIKQFLCFLIIVRWYSRFIENDSELKVTLFKLLQKGKTWEWSENQEEALKQWLAFVV